MYFVAVCDTLALLIDVSVNLAKTTDEVVFTLLHREISQVLGGLLNPTAFL